MIYALRGSLRAAAGRLTAWEYRDTAKEVKRRDGPVNGLYGGFVFLLSPALLDTGAKMPLAGRGTAHKRREAAGEYRDKGGHVGGPGGHKKPAPGCPRAGGCYPMIRSAGASSRYRVKNSTLEHGESSLCTASRVSSSIYSAIVSMLISSRASAGVV